MFERMLFIIQGVPALAYAAAAVMQFIGRDWRFAWINVCFAIANYLIFFGSK